MNLRLPQCLFNMTSHHDGSILFFAYILRMMLHLHMYSKHTRVTAYYIQEEGIDFGDSFYNVPTEDLELNSKIIP